jgi:hypothetical protein
MLLAAVACAPLPADPAEAQALAREESSRVPAAPSAEAVQRAKELAAQALELKRAGKPLEALAKAAEARAADPINREAYWVEAWVLAESGRRKEAAVAFNGFLLAAPGDARLDMARAALERLVVAGTVDRPQAGLPSATAPTAPATAPSWDAGGLEGVLANAPLKCPPERLGGGIMVKYKLRLDDGSEKGRKAVFKPRQSSPQSFTYEIAAYEIDRLCHMGHVPVTAKRALMRSDIPNSLLSSRLRFSGDLLGGSAQQWVDGASDPFGSGARSWAEDWLARLSKPGGSVPDLETARAVSDMFLLDYLQGNMDRFSGGNILRDGSGKLWFIDNSEGFGSSSQPRRDFDRVRRFDRSVMDALRKATEDDFTREVGPWLTDSELDGLLQRREYALKRLAALLNAYGVDAVYL